MRQHRVVPAERADRVTMNGKRVYKSQPWLLKAGGSVLAIGMMLLLFGCGGATPSESASSTPATTAHPTQTVAPVAQISPPRVGGSMAYDANTAQVILFAGGTATSGDLNDTWAWNGKAWRQLHPSTSPPIRMDAAIAYDATRGQLVLFGGVGNDGLPLGDTWTWDGHTWTQQHPTTSPSPRSGASMTYDTAHQRIVLFGGEIVGAGHSTPPVNDTWTWDGHTWTQQFPSISPPARTQASMIYDATHTRIILFGGQGGNMPLSDIWAWNGTTWAQLHPAQSPPARAQASAVYDSAAQAVVVVAGISPDASSGLADTWTWDGTTWSIHTSDPNPSGPYTLAAYDAAQQTLVLYTTPWGKYATPHSQTWLWRGGTWTMLN